MKIIDERETQKQTKKAKKQTKAEKNKGGGWGGGGGGAKAIRKGWELNDFIVQLCSLIKAS